MYAGVWVYVGRGCMYVCASMYASVYVYVRRVYMCVYMCVSLCGEGLYTFICL